MKNVLDATGLTKEKMDEILAWNKEAMRLAQLDIVEQCLIEGCYQNFNGPDTHYMDALNRAKDALAHPDSEHASTGETLKDE